jgi:hypothetical protein
MKLLLLLLSIIFSVGAVCLRKTVSIDCCEDMEMYEQCKNAQRLINGYCQDIIRTNNIYQLNSAIPKLGCENHIMCCTIFAINAPNGTLICQNMISYQKCKNTTSLLNEFILKAQAYVNISKEFIDGMPVPSCQFKNSLPRNNQNTIENYYESGSVELVTNLLLVMCVLSFFW